MTDEVSVTQADRDAAANLERFAYIGGPAWAGAFERGESDEDEIVQAFARHRLQSAPPSQDGVGAARQALSEYREAPFRSADWLATRMMDIFDRSNTKGDGSWSTTAASISDAQKALAEKLKAIGDADLTSMEFRVARADVADFVISNSASILAALSHPDSATGEG